MRRLHIGFASILCLVCCVGAAQKGSVSGLVNDPAGKPLQGATVTLLPETDPASGILHTVTDSEGRFKFSGLSAGRYRVETNLRDGLSAASTLNIASGDESATVQLTFALSQNAKAAATPALNLQAAGIRGYIDPGGYSAPAGAAAATDIVRTLSDVNRSENDESTGAGLACSRQADLLKVIVEKPDDADANRQLGEIYLAHRQPDKALPYLQHALSFDGGDTKTVLLLADAQIQTRQFQDARELLLKGAVQQERPAQVHRLLARADEGLGLFVQASQEYRAASAVDPTEQDVFGAGYELILAGSLDAADTIFAAGSLQFRSSILMIMGQGAVAFLQGHSAEATRKFLEAAALEPSDPRPYPFLSASASLSGSDDAVVRESFRRFYELASSNALAAYFYAVSLRRAVPKDGNRQSEKIQFLLKKAIELDPALARAHLELGSEDLDRQELQAAIDEFKSVVRIDPNMTEAHYKLSVAYRREGERENADREMHIFLAQKKTAASGTAPSDLSMEQFLSVLRQPAKASSEQAACTARP